MKGNGSRSTFVALSLVLLILISPVFTNATYRPVSQSTDLITQYSPVLKFNKAENFYPISVDYAITNGVLKVMKQSGSDVISTSPTSSMLASYTSDSYFLDNKLGGFS